MLLGGVCAAFALACAEVGTGPDVAAAIEFTPFPSPSVVVGDTLRDINGVVVPIRAIARNIRGDAITNAPLRYLYADALKDSVLRVDSLTGIVRGLRVTSTAARLAARVGASLQVLNTILVTSRPDSVVASTSGPLAVFTTTLPDTGRQQASLNQSPALPVTVSNIDAVSKVFSGVNGWLVRYDIVSPVNATNDTSNVVYLVDDAGRASVIDTTDFSGGAGRKVRVRAARFPAAGASLDSVIVRATVTYRGRAVPGSPVRFALPVRRGS